jgi:TonB family protein
MLDQLVESSGKSGDGARRGGFLVTTMLVVTAVFLGSMLYSLFAKDYGMGGSDLELSTLVAPVPVPEEEPPPPEPDKPEPEKQVKAAPNADVRKEIIQAMDESPREPEKVSIEKSNIPARRPDVYTVKGDTNLDANSPAPSTYKGPVSTNNQGIPGPGGNPNSGADTGGDAPPPPPPTPKPTPPPATPTPGPPKKVSLGVINGKAVRLVQPPYPAAAKAVRASGAVNVSVSIDVNGNVTSASAVSGHPLLRQAAESAARGSKFSPTVLSGQAVPVTGIIVYNFVAQ